MSLYRAVQFLKSRRENIFMMLGVGSVASELMWIIRLRNEREDLRTKTDTVLKTLQMQIDGKDIPADDAPAHKTPDTQDEILAQLQALDLKWRSEAVVLPKASEQPQQEQQEQQSLQTKFL